MRIHSLSAPCATFLLGVLVKTTLRMYVKFLHRWDPHFLWNDYVKAIHSILRKSRGVCGQLNAVKPQSRGQMNGSGADNRCTSEDSVWGCTCQQFSDHFGAMPGNLGLAQKQADISWWKKKNCSTVPRWKRSLGAKQGVLSSDASGRPSAYCVEIMAEIVDVLQEMRSKLPHESQQPFRIVHAAVGTGRPSKLFVPASTKGDELGGVHLAARGRNHTGMHAVNATTLDGLLDKIPSGRPDIVDFVIIDTEGNDPHVLFAGATTLSRTRFVMFENHNMGLWATVSLKNVIDFLDVLGFDCFWMMNDARLWQITGCDTNVDWRGWSNVGCARRGDVFHREMRRLAAVNDGIPSSFN